MRHSKSSWICFKNKSFIAQNWKKFLGDLCRYYFQKGEYVAFIVQFKCRKNGTTKNYFSFLYEKYLLLFVLLQSCVKCTIINFKEKIIILSLKECFFVLYLLRSVLISFQLSAFQIYSLIWAANCSYMAEWIIRMLESLCANNCSIPPPPLSSLLNIICIPPILGYFNILNLSGDFIFLFLSALGVET